MSAEPTHAALVANTAFYDAFGGGDYPAMAALWATHASIACIHPGWPALLGREAVLESWRRILSGSAHPRIACRDATAHSHDGCVLVFCQELVAGATLAATNAFVIEAGGWRMVLHQASQIAVAVPWREEPPSGAVH